MEDYDEESRCGNKKVENPYPLSVTVTSSLPSSSGGLTRQGSITKTNNNNNSSSSNCLCSPTTHAGSFRCRLHRIPCLQRTKSMDQDAPNNQQHHSKQPEPPTTTVHDSATIYNKPSIDRY